jgi:hypothetical protein
VIALKDRVTAGFIAGIVAGVAMNVIDYISFYINFSQELLHHWAAVMIYGRLPASIPESAFAQLGQLMFSGFLGIIFAYILLRLTSGNYLLKGWIYAVLMWFGIYALTILFRVPFLQRHTLGTVVTTFVSASIYGLILAEMLHRLQKVKT